MAATVAAAAMAAGARDATRLEPLVCFLIFCLFYYTNFFKVHVMRRNGDGSNSRGSRRDTTRLEPLVCYLFIYFRFTQCVETAMAAAAVLATTAAGARDAICLEPPVCFFIFLFFIFIKLMFILGPHNVSKWRWQQQQQGLETRQGMEMGLGIKRGLEMFTVQ
jgi:hypothetical protein